MIVHFLDVITPWAVGIFLFLVVLDEGRREDSSAAVIVAALVLVVVQAVALHWRHRRPER